MSVKLVWGVISSDLAESSTKRALNSKYDIAYLANVTLISSMSVFKTQDPVRNRCISFKTRCPTLIWRIVLHLCTERYKTRSIADVNKLAIALALPTAKNTFRFIVFYVGTRHLLNCRRRETDHLLTSLLPQIVPKLRVLDLSVVNFVVYYAYIEY